MLLYAISLVSALTVSAPSAMPAAEHPVAATYRQGVKDFNRHDLDGFMRQFADDIEMYTPTGWLRGKPAVRQRFADLFKQMPAVFLEATNLKVREVARGTAIVDFNWKVTGGPGMPSFGGVGTGVYVRRNGRWVEVVEHETLVPSRPAG